MFQNILLFVQAIDTIVNNFLLDYAFKYPTIIIVFSKITFFGSFQFIFLASIIFVSIFLVMYFLTDNKLFVNKYIYPYLFTIFATCISVYYLKLFFAVAGPAGRSLLESDYSFPSGHSSIAMAFFGLMYFLFKEKFVGNNKFFFFLFCFLMIILIGLSRLILDVHFLSDVLAGYFVGFVFLWIGKKL